VLVVSVFNKLVALRYKRFFNLFPSFDAPVLTSPSGWKWGEQAVARVVIVLGSFCLPMTLGVVGVLEGR
jgi:hypothetical protein